jgi:hypothetical protein
MTNLDLSGFDGFGAAADVQNASGDETNATTDNRSSLALRELISDEPILPVLQRKVKMSFAPKVGTQKVHSVEGELGHFFFSLLEPASNSFEKDGLALLQGWAPDGAGRNLQCVEVMVFDVDKGPEPDDLAERFDAADLAYAIHPSYNDGKTHEVAGLHLVHDWLVKNDIDGAPLKHERATPEQIMAYFRSQLSAGISDRMHSPVSFRTGGKEGPSNAYRVRIPEIRKFHVVIPLSRQLNVDELGSLSIAQGRQWSTMRRIVASALGITDDESCADITRLFYAHRRPKGIESWHLANFVGKALDVDKLLDRTPIEKEASTRKRSGNRPPRIAIEGHEKPVEGSEPVSLRAEFDYFWTRDSNQFDVEALVKTHIDDFEEKKDVVAAA